MVLKIVIKVGDEVYKCYIHQNLGFLFLPVYFVSGFVAKPLLRNLYFFFITKSFLFVIFFFPFVLNYFFCYLYLFTFIYLSPCSFSSPYSYISYVLPSTSTIPKLRLTPAYMTR